MSASAYSQALLLNFLLLGTGTAPSSWFLALYNGDPTSGGTEVTGTGYVRKAITFSAPVGGAVSNAPAITYSTVATNWNTITHYAIYDALSAGNLLVSGSLNAPLLVSSGIASLSVPVASLSISLE